MINPSISTSLLVVRMRMVRWAAAAAYTQDIAFVTGGYGEEVSAGSWGVEVFREWLM